jgi:hypothetical protein
MPTAKSNKLYPSFFKLASATLLITYLSGCTSPAMLGLNKNQWGRLSPEQQKTYMSNYHAITANLIHNSPSSSAQSLKIHTKPTALTTMLPDINLTVVSGQAAFAPDFKFMPISPLHVHLQDGLCQWALLQSDNQKKSSKLWFCYIQKSVGIDPSLYKIEKAFGTAFIDMNPLWNRGFTYQHIYTSGYTKLSDATITIQATSPIVIAQATDLKQQVIANPSAEPTHE